MRAQRLARLAVSESKSLLDCCLISPSPALQQIRPLSRLPSLPEACQSLWHPQVRNKGGWPAHPTAWQELIHRHASSTGRRQINRKSPTHWINSQQQKEEGHVADPAALQPASQNLDQAPEAAQDPGNAVQPSATRASDVQVAAVVDHPALVVTRNVEWGTVIFGFEQANRYTVLDQNGNTVALMAEELGTLGTEVGRQFLRTRRPFKATVFGPDGQQVIFTVRRPFYFINSSLFVEDGAGNVIGEVHQKWHLWRRRYDLVLNGKQFSAVNSGLLAWEFLLRDEAEGGWLGLLMGLLALIDRNFQGFGKEIFTDAGKYIVHFGDKPEQAAEQAANTVAAAHPDKPRPEVTTLAKYRNPDMSVVPTSAGDQLATIRSLQLDERMVALAAAISIDYDYFSQHSHGHGLLGPMMFPGPVIPYPMPGGGRGEGAEAGADAGAGAEGAAVPPEQAPSGQAPPQEDLSGQQQQEGLQDPSGTDLGGDDFKFPDDGFGGDEGDGGAFDGGGDGDGGSTGLLGSLWDAFSDD